jgi:ribosomal protein RSM22 (predicted rRNA methylase)
VTQPVVWYLANRATIVYSILHRVLSELKKRVPGFAPSSVLDYGSRTGVGAWAVASHFPPHHTKDVPDGVKTYVAVDDNTDFGYATQEFGKDSGMNIKVRPIIPALPGDVNTSSSTSASTKDSKSSSDEKDSKKPSTSSSGSGRRTGVTQTTLSMANADTQGPHSLVISAYALHSVPKLQRKVVLDQLWQNTSDVLILIESGDPQGFDTIRAARDYLLMNNKSKKDPVNAATAIAPVCYVVICFNKIIIKWRFL